MTLTISDTTISVGQDSFDTQFYRILVNLKEKKLVLEPCKEDEKYAIDLCKPIVANLFIPFLRGKLGLYEETMVFKGSPVHNGFCCDLDDPITLESATITDAEEWHIAKAGDFR